MASSLEEFVYRLANDQRFQDRFREDPEAVVAATDLPEWQKDLLLSGDAEGVAQVLGARSAAVVVVVSTSGTAASAEA